MKWCEMGCEAGINAVIYSLLFGIIMAVIVSAMRKWKMMRRGNSVIIVIQIVMGVAGTVACGVLANLIPIETALWLGLMFGASGFPMLIEGLLSDYEYQIEKELSDD